MNKIKFIWDDTKEKINIKKHKVSFIDAQTVFYDENARLIYDPDHSETEDRYIIVGLSKNMNLLTVCHCYKEKNEVIRIFSARKATKNESNEYWRMIK